MLVILSSASGAPGVSAWALALSIALPGRQPRVLLEADVAGGVLGDRYGLPVEPGAGSLVASILERPSAAPDVSIHGSRLGPGLWCIAGPATAIPSRQLWRHASAVAATLADDTNLWLVDGGRAEPSGALAPVLRRAMAHVVVTGGSGPALVKAQDHAERLPGPGRVALLVVAPGPSADRPPPAVGGDGVVVTAARPPSLGALAIRTLHSRRARRSRSWRTVERLADGLGRWLLAPPPPVVRRG